MRLPRRQPTLLALLLLVVSSRTHAQAERDSAPPRGAAVIGGAGYTIIHLPTFTYTRGPSREQVTEPAQEGGGLTAATALEVSRGYFMLGARYQVVVELMSENWVAHVGSMYAGVVRRRPLALFSAAIGPTVVHREQVTRQFAASGCTYWGCDPDLRVNRDGGTLTTVGLVATATIERRVGRFVGVGVDGYAAVGRQRYSGVLGRLSIGPR